jgi:hypothetical protein
MFAFKVYIPLFELKLKKNDEKLKINKIKG